MREPGRLVLDDVGDLDPEARAVTGGAADLVAGLRRDDDPDLLDAGRGHRLDAVEQHRLVGDRDQLLRRRMRDRAQAGALAARKDQAFERLHVGRRLVSPAQFAVIPGDAVALDELQRDPLRSLLARMRRACPRRRRRSARPAPWRSRSRPRRRGGSPRRSAASRRAARRTRSRSRPGASRAGRARGCAPSATSRRSRPRSGRRGGRTRAASGGGSRCSPLVAQVTVFCSARKASASSGGHLDGVAAAHGAATSRRSAARRTASRASAGSRTAASPASLSTSLTR